MEPQDNLQAFAHIPKEILTDTRMSLRAKGLYSVICTFDAETPVTLGEVAVVLGCDIPSIEPIWDEMVLFMELKEKEHQLNKAIAELAAEMKK